MFCHFTALYITKLMVASPVAREGRHKFFLVALGGENFFVQSGGAKKNYAPGIIFIRLNHVISATSLINYNCKWL